MKGILDKSLIEKLNFIKLNQDFLQDQPKKGEENILDLLKQ